MKRRKRTNSNVPAKGRLRDFADALWSLAVKADWNRRCAICGANGELHSHHLIPRHHEITRYDLHNGISLCRRCHLFCPDMAPHQNAMGFVLWLRSHYPEVASWQEEMEDSGDHRRFNGMTTATYYMEQIQRLQEYVEPDEFTRIVGKKFAAHLDSPTDT